MSALWLNRTEKRAGGTGCLWQGQWTHANNGIIPSESQQSGVGHFIILIGKKTIDNTPYLIAQNSVGQNVGQNGLYYFDRTTVNKEFIYGSYTVKDMPQKEAQKMSWTLMQRLRIMLKRFLIQ